MKETVVWNRQKTIATCQYHGMVGHINLFHGTRELVVVDMPLITALELLKKCRRIDEDLRVYPIQLQAKSSTYLTLPWWIRKRLDFNLVLVKIQVLATNGWSLVNTNYLRRVLCHRN